MVTVPWKAKRTGQLKIALQKKPTLNIMPFSYYFSAQAGVSRKIIRHG
jgi:hypothetical protein